MKTQNLGDESADRKTEQGQELSVKPTRHTRHENPLPCGCGIKGTSYIDPIGSRGYEYKDLFIDFARFMRPLRRSMKQPKKHSVMSNLIQCLTMTESQSWPNSAAHSRLLNVFRSTTWKRTGRRLDLNKGVSPGVVTQWGQSVITQQRGWRSSGTWIVSPNKTHS